MRKTKWICVLCCILLALCSFMLPVQAEKAEEPNDLPDGMTLIDSNDVGTLYCNKVTGEIGFRDTTGFLWRSAVSDQFDLSSVSESQQRLLTTPLIIEYTYLNSRSNDSTRAAISALGLTVTARDISDGVRLTFAATDIAVEIDLEVTLCEDGLTVTVPQDGIREGVGLTERLGNSMQVIRSNIQFIREYIDAMLEDPAISSHRRQVQRFSSSFEEYEEVMADLTTVVDIQYTIEKATSLLTDVQNIFKGGVGETGVFNRIVQDGSIDESIRRQYTALYSALDSKVTQTKLLSQQLATIKYGAIVSLSVFPNFGALGDREGGYVFYPDGSGALTYATEYHPAYRHFYLEDVYSSDSLSVLDLANVSSQGKMPVLMPVFGIKRAEQALFGIMTEGDAYAAVEFYPSGLDANVHRINAYFHCRRVATVYQNGTSRGSVYEIDRFDTGYAVRYSFLTGENANYSGMANCYRNYLLASGQLKKSSLVTESPSVALNIIMGVTKRGLLSSKLVATTTFSQASDILLQLQQKGIEGVLANMQGCNPSGSNPIASPSATIPSTLGGEKGLKSFSQTVDATGGKLLLQGNYIAATRSGSSFSEKDFAYSNTGNLITDSSRSLFLLKSSSLLDFLIKKLFPVFSKCGVNGISYLHSGRYLYYDYSDGQVMNRDGTSQAAIGRFEFTQDTLGLSAAKTAGAFAWGALDWVSNVPTEATGYVFTDEEVPFYEMVLHGYVMYTGKSFNKFYYTEYETMKALEYGCLPVFDLTWESTETLKNSSCFDQFSTRYSDWEETITDVSKEFGSLASLRDKVILSHSRPDDASAVVVYEDGTRILFNYHDSAVVIEGVTVPAMTYRVMYSEEG